MSENFIGAKPSGWARWLGRAAPPLILPRLQVTEVNYDLADLERLRALRPLTVLLTPNHPTNSEPALLFHEPFLKVADVTYRQYTRDMTLTIQQRNRLRAVLPDYEKKATGRKPAKYRHPRPRPPNRRFSRGKAFAP